LERKHIFYNTIQANILQRKRRPVIRSPFYYTYRRRTYYENVTLEKLFLSLLDGIILAYAKLQ